MPNGEELVLETLINFCHFESAPGGNFRDNLGVPLLGSETKAGVRGVGVEVVDNDHGENRAVSTCRGVDDSDDDEDDDYGEGNDDSDDDDDDGDATGLEVEAEDEIRRRIIAKASVINDDGPKKDGAAVEGVKNGIKKKASKLMTFSQIQWIGE